MASRTGNGMLRWLRKTGNLEFPPKEHSRLLARLILEGTALQQGWSAREVATALRCSRRTARRAMTYARRYEEVRHA